MRNTAYNEYVKIAKLVKDMNIKTWIDVGCGEGTFLSIAKEKLPNVKVIGVDRYQWHAKFTKEEISKRKQDNKPATLDEFKQMRKNLDGFQNIDVLDLPPCYDNTAELVSLIHFTYWSNHEKMKQIFKRCAKLVKPGGHVLISGDTPTWWCGLLGVNFTNKFISFQNMLYRDYNFLFRLFKRLHITERRVGFRLMKPEQLLDHYADAHQILYLGFHCRHGKIIFYS